MSTVCSSQIRILNLPSSRSTNLRAWVRITIIPKRQSAISASQHAKSRFPSDISGPQSAPPLLTSLCNGTYHAFPLAGTQLENRFPSRGVQVCHGAIHHDMAGTFESDIAGTFKPLQSTKVGGYYIKSPKHVVPAAIFV